MSGWRSHAAGRSTWANGWPDLQTLKPACWGLLGIEREAHRIAAVMTTRGAAAGATVPRTGVRRAGALLGSLRPRQWTKNGLLFVPLVFAVQFGSPEADLRAVAAFALFCALSSAGYLLNDIADRASDRQHPRKRFRPIASGAVPVPLAFATALTLAGGGILGSVALDRAFGTLAVVYLAITAAYTVWLKHYVLLDLFGIAAGFVVRAAAGAAAISVPVSPWLYIATMLGALLIGLGKRRSELRILGDGAGSHRRNLEAYTLELVDQLILIVSSAAVMTYALYTFSAENLPQNRSMMLTIPVILYGLFRYLFLLRGEQVGGAPEELLFRDRPLLAAVVLWLVLSAAILVLGRGT